jgi:hypothetical protein
MQKLPLKISYLRKSSNTICQVTQIKHCSGPPKEFWIGISAKSLLSKLPVLFPQYKGKAIPETGRGDP